MKKTLFILLLACFISGCATAPLFHVNVNSFMRPNSINNGTYILIPAEEGKALNDLEFIEYSTYVENVMSEKGFTRIDDFNSADLAVFLSYGIGDPEHVNYSYSLPTWGQTGVAASYTTGTVNVIGNSATFTGTTTNVPQFGVTGSTTHSGTRTTFTRRASLRAYNLEEYRLNDKESIIWDTRIVSTGSSGDLRRVFPILIAAAADHIGTNTGRMVLIKLKEEDPRVKEIKGISK